MQHLFLLHSPTEVGFFIRGLTVCRPEWREQGLQPQPDPGNRWCPRPKLSPYEDVLTTPQKCRSHISCRQHQRRPSGSSPSCALCLVSEGLPAQYETPTGKKKQKQKQLVEKSNKLPGALQGWNVKPKGNKILFVLSPAFHALQSSVWNAHKAWTAPAGASGLRGAGGKALQGGWGESTVGKLSRMF